MATPVADGPRWFRSRIRTQGPFVALVPPVVLGAVSLGLLQVGTSWSGYAGLIGGVCAAPGLLAVGAPFATTSRYPIGIALSVVFWVSVGFVCSRRATRNPTATWSDFWRNYRWLAAATCIGAAAALIVAAVTVGGLI